MADDPDEGDLSVLRELLGFSPAPDVEAEPYAEMSPWIVFEVMPSGERHLCGWIGYEGRVSSAITAYDPETRIARTRSGRRYHLVGPPGSDRDALWVWQQWRSVNGVTSEEDVSADYLAKEPREA